MELQQNFKCKTCGRPLDALVAESTNGLVECPSCYNIWTIPRKETSPASLQFLRMGEHDLDVGKFDDALTAYSKAAQLDPKEPEAYFGMALAQFKVRYLYDHTNNRLQPICYEITDKKFSECETYLQAYANATPEQREEYVKKAMDIDYILNEFFKLQASGKRYDCFLCVKVSDPETKRLTEDSKDAEYIYHMLKEKGYKPFYSEMELRNVTGADYEARIMYALYTSECMLVICHNEDFLQTPWVKNEYTRFLKLVNDAEKESDSLTIVFSGRPIEKLPGRAGKIQGIDFQQRNAESKVVEFVDAHTPESRRRREAERKRKEEQEQAILQQIEAQKQQQRELEDRLKNLQGGGGMQATASSLLTRGYQELASSNKKGAGKFFDRVLEAEPTNGEAWWGKALIEVDAWNDDLLNEKLELDSFETLSQSRNYANAVKYAEGAFKDRLTIVQERLKRIAEMRKEDLEGRRYGLSSASVNDQNRNSERIVQMQHRLNEAAQQVRVATENLPKKKPDEYFYTDGYTSAMWKTAVAVTVVLTVLITVFFRLLPAFATKLSPALLKIIVALAWNNGNLGFGWCLARGLAYGGGTALLIVIAITIGMIVKYSKWKKKVREYRIAEAVLADAAEELIEAKKDMESGDSRYAAHDKEMSGKINELTKAIDIYNFFIV